MTEHKFTDEEVIKGLECLMGEHIVCKECAYSKINGGFSCKKKSATNALDLINRQKAEVAYWQDEAVNAKREAVKEFAEIAKRRLPIVSPAVFDGIAKKLMEDKG